jgi:hypothetical protein
LRDLFVVQSFFPHQERKPVSFGERVDRLARQRAFLCPFHSTVRWLDECIATFLSQQPQLVAPAILTTCLVSHKVGRHSKKPRAFVR